MKRCPKQHPMEGPEAIMRTRSGVRGVSGKTYTWDECLRCERDRRKARTAANAGKPKRVLTDQEREMVLVWLEFGRTTAEIARMYEVDVKVIYRIRDKARQGAA
jgi:hypothetical protein